MFRSGGAVGRKTCGIRGPQCPETLSWVGQCRGTRHRSRRSSSCRHNGWPAVRSHSSLSPNLSTGIPPERWWYRAMQGSGWSGITEQLFLCWQHWQWNKRACTWKDTNSNPLDWEMAQLITMLFRTLCRSNVVLSLQAPSQPHCSTQPPHLTPTAHLVALAQALLLCGGHWVPGLNEITEGHMHLATSLCLACRNRGGVLQTLRSKKDNGMMRMLCLSDQHSDFWTELSAGLGFSVLQLHGSLLDWSFWQLSFILVDEDCRGVRLLESDFWYLGRKCTMTKVVSCDLFNHSTCGFFQPNYSSQHFWFLFFLDAPT